MRSIAYLLAFLILSGAILVLVCVKRPVPAGERQLTLVLQTGHTGRVSSVALSSDGNHVVTGSWDKTAILWGATTGKQLQSFQGHTNLITSVGLSGDAKRVAT